MIQISDNTQPDPALQDPKMFNKALEYDRVLSFTLGEPDFTASANVVEAGCRAIREGKTKYSENAGLLGSAPGYRPLSCAYRRAVLQSGEPDRSNARSYGSIVFSPEGAAEPRR